MALATAAGTTTVASMSASAATVTLEAENAQLAGGAVVAKDHSGYSGSGFVGGFTDGNRGSASTRFTAQVGSSGSYAVGLRYANGTSDTKTLSISIDGGAPEQVSLPATSSWDAWSTLTRPANLTQGTHTVTVSFGNRDSGNVNLDRLELTTDNATTPTAGGPKFEAENASLTGGAVVDTEHSGASGNKYAGGFTDSNRGKATASFAVDRDKDGPVDLELRYANGTGSARTFSLIVDGKTDQVSLAPTANWGTWGTVTTRTSLTKGKHTIAYRFGDDDSGNANLDSLTVTAATVDPTNPPVDPTNPPVDPTNPPVDPSTGADEAESAFLSGGAAVATSTSGFTGSGYVRGFDKAGARLVRTVSMGADGTAKLTVRSSATGSARTLAVIANGRAAGELALPSGSDWKTTTLSLGLNAGLNTVQLRASNSGADVLIDSIAIDGDQALAKRGATLPYVEYQAEDGKTNANTIAADRTYGTIAAESSGRRAVVLSQTGHHIDVTLTKPANAIVVRFSIPDTADGRGQTAPLALYADGKKVQDLSLSSTYSWVYGEYPYNNDPNGGGAHRFYDEIRAKIPSFPAGTVLSLQKDASSTAASYTIDLIDAEVAPKARTAPQGAIDITSKGAQSGNSDSTSAIESAISAAKSAGKPVWIPEGSFRITKRVNLEGVTVLGAGPWYSVIRGTEGKGGFFATGSNVTVADIMIDGNARVRDDANFDTAIEGNFGEGSLVQNVWVEHSKVGMWIDSGTRGLAAVGLRIRDTYADGVNMHADVVGAEFSQSSLRNTGDDALAMWSDGAAVTRSAYRFNTVQNPVLANGIGIYGGNSNSATDNMISDTLVAASGIAVGTRFNPVPLSGTTTIARNTLERTGSREVNWQTDLGALWIYADTSEITAPIEVRDMDIRDSTFQGVLISYQKAVRELSFDRVTIAGAGSYGFELNATGKATVSNTAVSGAKSGGVLNQLGYVLEKGSGNSGF